MEKTYLAKTVEQEIKNFWREKQIYHFDKNSDKPVFSIDTPPPTVSGNLHIGHVFSYLHADIIARYKRMSGMNVYYPMGFDDNGLPTEKFVEKKRNVRSKTLPRSEFIAMCLEECKVAEEQFSELWQSIGLSIDWNYVYSTIGDLARKVSQESFLDLLKKGLIYRKFEPALFCTDFRTTVAQAELESVEKPTTFNTINFATENGQTIQIATTRPELLAACVAIFYHPDDARFTHLKNQFAITPIYGKKVPFLADDKVLPEKGTGLVMCCTFGDQTDVLWFKKHNLSYIQAIGFDGKMTSVAGELAGLKVQEARSKIIDLLKTSGHLIEQKALVHNVSVYERSKKEIEYLILPQWFIKIVEYKKTFLDTAKQIDWHPQFMHSRYQDWVENLSWDWCISRQRFFGVPFPAWHCQDCQEIIVAKPETLPVDPQEQKCPQTQCPKCQSTNLIGDTDVMDTWATSASTPQINAALVQIPAEKFLPMSMRPQAHDIIRTWAFDTIVKSVFNNDTKPWQAIVLSGHVLAGDKAKFSKSAGNANITPENLVLTYSADAIRFWSAKGKLGVDTPFSPDQLKIGQKLVTKLFNAFKFISEHARPVTNSNWQPDALGQWILTKFSQTQTAYHKHFAQYDYTVALEEVDQFFWQDFCDNYLEMVKDQVFHPELYSENVQELYGPTLHLIGLGLLQLYSPFVPFITEYLFSQVYKSTSKNISVHTSQFDQINWQNYQKTEVLPIFEQILKVIDQVRKTKSQHNVSLKMGIETLIIQAEPGLQASLTGLEQILKGVCQAKELAILDTKNPELPTTNFVQTHFETLTTKL